MAKHLLEDESEIFAETSDNKPGELYSLLVIQNQVVGKMYDPEKEKERTISLVEKS